MDKSESSCPQLTVAALLDLLDERHRLDALPSAGSTEAHGRPVRRLLGNLRAAALDTEELDGYRETRIKEGVSRATVNRELGVLKAAYRHASRIRRQGADGRKRPLIAAEDMPHFPLFRGADRPRQGFIELEDFRALLAVLPAHIGDLATWLYLTGWRSSAALALGWEHVDWARGLVVKPSARNKGCGPVPIVGAVRELLDRRYRARRSVLLEDPVFTRHDGRPLRSFRNVWERAVARAGMPKLRPHDLRRSFARNAVRAGVPIRHVMALGGWKTMAMFHRYAIVEEDDLREEAERIYRLDIEKHNERATKRARYKKESGCMRGGRSRSLRQI